MASPPFAVPLSVSVDSPNFPGGTPRVAHAYVPPPTWEGALRAPATPGLAIVRPPAALRRYGWALEPLEDAFLLLLLVFAVPVVMLLLALPFGVFLHLAGLGESQ